MTFMFPAQCGQGMLRLTIMLQYILCITKSFVKNKHNLNTWRICDSCENSFDFVFFNIDLYHDTFAYA